ncbi:hypothetical protein SESBI_15896 [Sesbania bispinosa]|nr:hypothetical protein SESBI_15896 [Sesbania bispinosa]
MNNHYYQAAKVNISTNRFWAKKITINPVLKFKATFPSNARKEQKKLGVGGAQRPHLLREIPCDDRIEGVPAGRLPTPNTANLHRERNRKPNRGGAGERGEGGDATLELKMRGPSVCEVYGFDSSNCFCFALLEGELTSEF